MTKTATLTFRVDPRIKQALHTAAEREHRSAANMMEVLVRDYCQRHGIAFEETTSTEHKGKQSA